MSTASELMQRIGEKIGNNPDVAQNFEAIYRFVLEGEGGGTYLVNLKDAPGVQEAEGPADCSLALAASDFVDLLEGRANGQQLFFQGKLRIDGDMGLALKLENLANLGR